MTLESTNAEGTWYDGAWNDWRWRTQITGVPRVHRHLHLVRSSQGRGPTGNDVLLGRTSVRHSGIRPLTLRVMIHRSMVKDGEVIPPFERRVRLFVSNRRVVPERRAGKLLERLEGLAFDSCVKEYRTWQHRMVLRI